MSKGQKKKVNVKIYPGEAIFVAPMEVMEHIHDTYMCMAEGSSTVEDADSWREVAEQIKEWSHRTYFSGEEQEDEEW
jgi:hypothetical protein